MPWTIEMQEEVGKGEKREVKVKEVKFFPIAGADGRIERFGALGFLLIQVVIKHDKGSVLKLKLNASQGINNPSFTVQHEDGFEHPLIWIGQGKRRMQVSDTLAPKCRTPGEREKYDNLTQFEKRVKQFGGDALVNEVTSLFATKLGEVVSRKDKKRQKAA